MILRPLIPPLVARDLGRRMLALVIRRHGDVENALFGPGPPILIDSPEGLRRIPPGLGRRAPAERDQRRRHLHMRPDGDGVEIDATNQIADLIAAPLVPE